LTVRASGEGGSESVRELFVTLWNDPRERSRNANYARYRDDRKYRHVVHHVRSLRAFVHDLERFHGRCDLVVRPLASGRGAQITMRVPALSLIRHLFVAGYEMEVLRREPGWISTPPTVPEPATSAE
jgi:hypothetical protein